MPLLATSSNHWKIMRIQFGKLTKEKPSGRAKKHLNARDHWIMDRYGFLRDHITRKELSAVRSQEFFTQLKNKFH